MDHSGVYTLFLRTAPDILPTEVLLTYLVQGFGKDDKGLTVLSIPQENPGPPLYTSGTGTAPPGQGFGAIRTDGEWVAITFTRDPGCVPEDYNLLGPPNVPAVFRCTLTIGGRVWYQNPPDLAGPPIKAEQVGLGAVPIYFAHLSEYEAAAADGELTIVDFNSLPSLQIGYAGFHLDVIQFPLNGRPGTATVVSRGDFADGRSFQLDGTLVGAEWHITIRFE